MKKGNPFEAFAFGGGSKELAATSPTLLGGVSFKTVTQAVGRLPAAAANQSEEGDGCNNPAAATPDLISTTLHAKSPATTPATTAGAAAAGTGATPPPSRSSTACHRTRSSSTAAAATAAPAAAAPKRQRKAYAALTGPPKGLPEKLGDGPLRLILDRHMLGDMPGTTACCQEQQHSSAAAKGKQACCAPATCPPICPSLGTSPASAAAASQVGHNPSEHAWHTGHYYSNPSNRMWRVLDAAGITPPGVSGPEADDLMPAAMGVGFTDVGGGQPGTDSSKFTAAHFQH
ncbi:hypothetical protein COO60DRAFT_452007 [Scenedesmus sp. NREL 46B-D3]|nr:hypothetical protein COO60DRAFT_452007 [Scenedesmus sp. NREL 46B-D3]